MSLLDERSERGRAFRLEPSNLRVATLLIFSSTLFILESVIAMQSWLRTDICTILVVFVALEYELIGGLLAALLVGYVADLFSGHGIGLSAATSVVVFLMMRLVVARIVSSRAPIVTMMTILATFGAFLVRWSLEYFLGPGVATWSGTLRGLPSLLLTGLVFGYPLYRFLAMIDARFRPREDFSLTEGRVG